MQRILVAGITGAGKTTTARELARRLSLPFVEVDALHHGAGWTRRPSFDADVSALAATDRWVVDSVGYPSVRDLLWDRADAVVWLDYDRPVVMRRVVARTLRRLVTRQELWNGNRERLRNVHKWDAPIRWAWSQHGPRRALIAGLAGDARWHPLKILRFTTPDAADLWLDSVTVGKD